MQPACWARPKLISQLLAGGVWCECAPLNFPGEKPTAFYRESESRVARLNVMSTFFFLQNLFSEISSFNLGKAFFHKPEKSLSSNVGTQ